MSNTGSEPSPATPDPLRWWTDAYVEAGVLALWDVSECRPTLAHKITNAVLAALSPRVAALVADAERAGAVKALREAADDLELDKDAIAGLWMRTLGGGDNSADDPAWTKAYAFADEIERGAL